MEIEGLIHGLATNLIFTAAAQLLEHTAPVKSEGLWFKFKGGDFEFFHFPTLASHINKFLHGR